MEALVTALLLINPGMKIQLQMKNKKECSDSMNKVNRMLGNMKEEIIGVDHIELYEDLMFVSVHFKDKNVSSFHPYCENYN